MFFTYYPNYEIVPSDLDKDKCLNLNQEELYKNNVNVQLQDRNLEVKFPLSIISPKTSETDIYYHYLMSEFIEGCWISYLLFIDICKKHNIDYVVDVGCSLGVQSLMFTQHNIEYHGIDVSFPFFPYYYNKRESTKFSILKYPFTFTDGKELMYNKNHKNCAIVSSLCMFWIIHKSIEEQLYYIRNFKKGIFHIPTNIDLSLFEKNYNIEIYYKDRFGQTIYISWK